MPALDIPEMLIIGLLLLAMVWAGFNWTHPAGHHK
jgi:hypothetical protein